MRLTTIWENDASRPDLDTLIKLSNLYGLTLVRLVNGKEQPVVKSAAREDVDRRILLITVKSHSQHMGNDE